MYWSDYVNSPKKCPELYRPATVDDIKNESIHGFYEASGYYIRTNGAVREYNTTTTMCFPKLTRCDGGHSLTCEHEPGFICVPGWHGELQGEHHWITSENVAELFIRIDEILNS